MKINKNKKRSVLYQLIKLEILMIVRLERTRTIFLGFLLAQIGMLFFGFAANDSRFLDSSLVKVSIIAIILAAQGVFSVSYGQYHFGWDANYFSVFSTQQIDLRLYILARMITLILLMIFPALFMIPHFANSAILKPYICCLLYNIGVVPFFVMLLALHNYRKINFNKKGIFANYEGGGKVQQILGLLIYAPSFILIIIGYLLKNFNFIYLSLAIIGLLKLCMLYFWSKRFSYVLMKRKYMFLSAFNDTHDRDI